MLTSEISKMAIVSAAVAGLLVLAQPGHAQQGPFAGMNGAWSGTGTVTMSSGTRERIQCRANYEVTSGGSGLQLGLRCASDSYNFNLGGSAQVSGDGSLSGYWNESTRGAAGQFAGRVRGGHIEARIEGQTFAAFLDVNTHGNRQAISIRSPGSQFSEIRITLSHR